MRWSKLWTLNQWHHTQTKLLTYHILVSWSQSCFHSWNSQLKISVLHNTSYVVHWKLVWQGCSWTAQDLSSLIPRISTSDQFLLGNKPFDLRVRFRRSFESMIQIHLEVYTEHRLHAWFSFLLDGDICIWTILRKIGVLCLSIEFYRLGLGILISRIHRLFKEFRLTIPLLSGLRFHLINCWWFSKLTQTFSSWGNQS